MHHRPIVSKSLAEISLEAGTLYMDGLTVDVIQEQSTNRTDTKTEELDTLGPVMRDSIVSSIPSPRMEPVPLALEGASTSGYPSCWR